MRFCTINSPSVTRRDLLVRPHHRADAYKFLGVGKIQQNALWDRKSGFLQPCGVSQSAFVEARGSASLPKKG